MRIYGIDFTSAPRRRKPITCAAGWLEGSKLAVEEVERFVTFAEFEAWLERPGPWRAALDFPFGMPRQFLDGIGLDGSWEASVASLADGDRNAFRERIRRYRDSQPAGHKHHLRPVDRLAKSCSPMMVYGVPVGLMFFEGARRLARSSVCALPCRPNADSRVAVEGYPKLVVERYASGRPYKTERSHAPDEPQRQAARRQAIRGMLAHSEQDYGVALSLAASIQSEAEFDSSGDTLDAIACALQAAWSVRTGLPKDGIPTDTDPCEGWIVDPKLL
jgi:hypothetical protein